MADAKRWVMDKGVTGVSFVVHQPRRLTIQVNGDSLAVIQVWTGHGDESVLDVAIYKSGTCCTQFAGFLGGKYPPELGKPITVKNDEGEHFSVPLIIAGGHEFLVAIDGDPELSTLREQSWA